MADDIPWQRLFEAASAARANAYAPYSNFRVGAAALGTDGSITSGANVENASYGLTVCAERHAVAGLVNRGTRGLRAVAVCTDAKEPTPPCGACRQVLAEFADGVVWIASRGALDRELRFTLAELLPAAFTAKSM